MGYWTRKAGCFMPHREIFFWGGEAVREGGHGPGRPRRAAVTQARSGRTRGVSRLFVHAVSKPSRPWKKMAALTPQKGSRMPTPNPLRALGGRGQYAPNGEKRPTRTLGLREVAEGVAGLALGGLAVTAVHKMHLSRFRTAPVTPIRENVTKVTKVTKVTVAWAASEGTLFAHPKALMEAAASAVASELEVELREERGLLSAPAQNALVDPPRVLFFRMGGRLSTSHRLQIKKLFDRRRSSRCLVVLMFNADLDHAERLDDQGPGDLGRELSEASLLADDGVTTIHTRESTVPIECAYAFFEEGTLHPLEGERAVNKRAVDAIVALIRGPPSRVGGRML
jgi:hypothetical protein